MLKKDIFLKKKPIVLPGRGHLAMELYRELTQIVFL